MDWHETRRTKVKKDECIFCRILFIIIIDFIVSQPQIRHVVNILFLNRPVYPAGEYFLQ